MAAPVRIRFEAPGQSVPMFYRRDGDVIVIRGEQFRRPEVTNDPHQAHRFSPESAVSFRDYWRRMFPAYRISIETLDGTTLFERDQSKSVSEDLRQSVWVPEEPYDPNTVLELLPGYLVQPARRPDGLALSMCPRLKPRRYHLIARELIRS